MKTNFLEYDVPESVRTLRVLHLKFAEADSPDRMSNLAQGSWLVAGMPPTRGVQHHCHRGSGGSTESTAVMSPATNRRAQGGASCGLALRTRFSRDGSSAGLCLLASGRIPRWMSATSISAAKLRSRRLSACEDERPFARTPSTTLESTPIIWRTRK